MSKLFTGMIVFALMASTSFGAEVFGLRRGMTLEEVSGVIRMGGKVDGQKNMYFGAPLEAHPQVEIIFTIFNDDGKLVRVGLTSKRYSTVKRAMNALLSLVKVLDKKYGPCSLSIPNPLEKGADYTIADLRGDSEVVAVWNEFVAEYEDPDMECLAVNLEAVDGGVCIMATYDFTGCAEMLKSVRQDHSSQF